MSGEAAIAAWEQYREHLPTGAVLVYSPEPNPEIRGAIAFQQACRDAFIAGYTAAVKAQPSQ